MGKCKVYVGCKMTDLLCDRLIADAQDIVNILYEAGLEPYHPVLKENIPNEHRKLKERTPEEMKDIWDADKAAVKDADVLLDTAPHLFSAGLKEEAGKSRYRDWKPTVSIYPEGYAIPHIPRTEKDFVTSSPKEAAEYIQKNWGTRHKRMLWRLGIYKKHWKDVSLRKLVEFFR